MGSDVSAPVNRPLIKRLCWWALLAFVLLAGTTGRSTAGQRTVVAVGLVDAYPYSYLDKAGKPAGIYVDLARAIAAEADWQLEVKLMEWAPALEALGKGEVDLHLSVLAGDVRAWEFTTSEAHSVMEISFFTFTSAGAAAPSSALNEPGAKVGVHELIADMETLKALPVMSQMVAGRADGLFALLEKRNVEAVLCPRETGLRQIQEARLSHIALQPQPTLSRNVCFAARREQSQLLTELNEELRRLKETGRYYQLAGRPFSPPERSDPAGITLSHVVLPLVFTLIVLVGYAIMERRREALGRTSLWVVLGACLAMEVTFVGMSHLQERDAAVTRVREQLQTVAELNGMLVMRRIERARASVESILSDPLLLAFGEAALGANGRSDQPLDDQVGDEAVYALRTRLEGLTRGWTRSEAFLRNPFGLVLLSTNPIHDGTTVDSSAYLQPANAFRGGGFTVDLYRPSSGDGAGIEFTMPLGGDTLSADLKETVIVAVLRIILEEFLYPFPRDLPDMGATGEVLLFRKDGDQYLCVNNARLVPNTSLRLTLDGNLRSSLGEVVGSALEGRAGVTTVRDYRDIQVICAYYPIIQPVSGLAWAMLVKRDEAEALAPVNQSLKEDVVLVVSYALAIALLGTLRTRSMSRRIKSLDEMTRKITNGNLDIEPPPAGDDDISRLAQSLKAMSDSVKKRLSLAEHLSGLGRLSAGMAHEVRTPLTSIKVILQSLEMQLELDEDQKEDFLVMQKEIARLNDLVTRYLSFAKPPELNLRPLDLNGLLENIETLLQARIEGREDVQIWLELSEAPLEILGDEAQLSQVFLNLCVNAVDAMPDGGILTITSRRVAGHWPPPLSPEADPLGNQSLAYHDFIEATITDTGQGVPEKDRLAIFDPFFTTKEKGTGLGLAIAWSIVERHSGKLLVEGGAGGGCTFKVIFPVLGEGENEKNPDC